MTKKERKRKKEFKRLLTKFSFVLLEKLLANERKYRFGDSWKVPNWESQLQRDLLHHVQKGDPRDTAIFSLFAWYHGWPTAEKQLTSSKNQNPLTFICKGCRCELERAMSLRTVDYCYLCDPAISIAELLSDQPITLNLKTKNGKAQATKGTLGQNDSRTIESIHFGKP